jgi:hypothetical protein
VPEVQVQQLVPTIAASLGAAYVGGRRIEAGVLLLEEAVNPGCGEGIVCQSHSLWLVYLGEAYLHARVPRNRWPSASVLQLCRKHGERGYEAWAFDCLAISQLRPIHSTIARPRQDTGCAYSCRRASKDAARGTLRARFGSSRGACGRPNRSRDTVHTRCRAVPRTRHAAHKGSHVGVRKLRQPLTADRLSRRLGVADDLRRLRAHISVWVEQSARG